MSDRENDMSVTSPRRSETLLGALGRWYYPLAMSGRLPFAMTVVGVFTLVVSVTGSYSAAGITSATVGIGTAICGPILGMLADRFGQRNVLLAASLTHSVSLVMVALLTYRHAPLAALVICAFMIGASAPQMAAMSRARLVNVIYTQLPQHSRAQVLSRAMAIESTGDELVFVLGPVAVGVLAPTIGAWAPLTLAALITAVSVSGFALHPTSRRLSTESRKDQLVAPLRSVAAPKIVVLAVAMFFIGWFFGAMFTGLTSFMNDRGLEESTGVVYAALGLGSAAFALAMMIAPREFTLRWRYLFFTLVALVSSLFVPMAGSIWEMSIVLVFLGIGLGPVLVTLFSLGSHRAPTGRSATVMTILSSAVVVGQSISTACMGSLVDAHGTRAVIWVPVIALCGLTATALVNMPLGASDPTEP